MPFSKYDASDDPYAYPNTQVLKNRIDLRDADELEAFELEMTALRAEEPLPQGAFDARHYCQLHYHLYQDVYDWAGEYRNARTSKGGNTFCLPEFIDSEMAKLFHALAEKGYLKRLAPADFVKQATWFLSELNAIHPFREGNGRTQLAFLDMLAAEAGYSLRLEDIQPGPFMAAMIASFNGELALLEDQLSGLLVV